jgi:hypothetical protein
VDNPNEQQTEHVLRTRAEGLTAHFLELRPKPGRSNSKSKTFLMRGVGLAVVANDQNLWPQRTEKHPQRADEAEMKPVAVRKAKSPVQGSCDE